MGVVFLIGPTACGKSRTAVEIAHALDGEIINMDSMQIYDGMRIGSARPSQEEMEGIPHHLYGVVPMGEAFSAAEYKNAAMETMEEIQKRGKLPIFCGGTGLYLNAMTYRMDFGRAQGDPSLRERLMEELAAKGAMALHQRLCVVDPPTGARLHPNDVKRVLRALEVYEATGMPLSEQGDGFTKMEQEAYDFLILGLTMERETLYRRIDSRVDAMLNEGLLEECRTLLSKGIPLDHPSMMGIGYRQVFPYLQGSYGYDEMVERIKRETRRYAKRQLTWFRRDQRIQWLDVGDFSGISDLREEILSIIKEKSVIWRDLCDYQ
jgi:tRNA dimethylallyltransferase